MYHKPNEHILQMNAEITNIKQVKAVINHFTRAQQLKAYMEIVKVHLFQVFS